MFKILFWQKKNKAEKEKKENASLAEKNKDKIIDAEYEEID